MKNNVFYKQKCPLTAPDRVISRHFRLFRNPQGVLRKTTGELFPDL